MAGVGWDDCRAALAQKLATLGLDGLDPARIYQHLAGNPGNVTLPALELTTAGLVERWSWFTTDALKWEYPVGVLILFRGDPKDPAKEAPYMAWRQAIMEALPPWKPPLDGCMRCRVEPAGNVSGGFRARGEPGQVRDPQGPAWLKVAGSLVAWFELIKPRAEG